MTSCTSDDPSSPPAPQDDLIATLQIDPAGGTLGDDRIFLEIPAGAFSAPSTLSLYETREGNPQAETAVTPVFRLEGLPQTRLAPLRMALRYSGDIEDDSFLFFGTNAFDPSLDQSLTHFFPQAAVDSSGYLVGELPASGSGVGKSRAAETRPFKITGNSSYRGKLTEHFKVKWFKWDSSVVGDSVASFLEQSIGLVDQLGFDTVALLGPKGEVFVSSDDLDRSHGSIIEQLHLGFDRTLDMSVFAGGDAGPGLSTVRRITLSTFFNLIPLRHIPQGSWTRNAWWNHATVLWSGTLAPGWSDYVSPEFRGHEHEPLAGLQGGGPNDIILHREHGLGMLPLVRYLTDQYGASVVYRVYREIKAHDGWPVESINGSITDPTEIWWPHFLKTYVAGEIYDVSASVFTERRSGTLVVTQQERQKTFTEDYPSVSAKLFMVDFGDLSYESSDEVVFRATSSDVAAADLLVQVFKYKDGVLEFLSEAAEVTVTNVADMAAADWQLAALVVNSDDDFDDPDLSRIDLTVEVTNSGAQTLPYRQCALQTFVNARYVYSTGQDNWATGTFNIEGEGSFAGNVFTAVWQNRDDGYELHNGRIELTIDPVNLSIIGFSMTDTMGTLADGVIIQADGGGLQDPAIDSHSLYYRIEGADVGVRLTHLYWSSASETYTAEMVEWSAGEFSTLELLLDEWTR